jgi:hypothetical protein
LGASFPTQPFGKLSRFSVRFCTNAYTLSRVTYCATNMGNSNARLIHARTGANSTGQIKAAMAGTLPRGDQVGSSVRPFSATSVRPVKSPPQQMSFNLLLPALQPTCFHDRWPPRVHCNSLSEVRLRMRCLHTLTSSLFWHTFVNICALAFALVFYAKVLFKDGGWQRLGGHVQGGNWPVQRRKHAIKLGCC